jgi:hypothetical protein
MPISLAAPFRITLNEDFENPGGWTDHNFASNIGDPITASTGSWIIYYAAAVSYVPFAHSGQRYIQCAASGSPNLELPPVDRPMRLAFWARLPPERSTATTVTIQYYAGISWYTAGSVTVTSQTYAPFVLDINIDQPSQRLRVVATYVFIDDIEILSN